MRFETLFAELSAIGRVGSGGGLHRHAWNGADAAARAWFAATAADLDLKTATDRNGNLWAWWGPPAEGSVVTGSHLDSVVDGGAYDGALGIVAALLAVAALKAEGHRPERSIAICAFIEEEGARFGVPTLGSRLMTGAIEADRVRHLEDEDGITFAEAMEAAGCDPDGLGRDPDAMSAIGAFVELHIEQGRALGGRDLPVGVISDVWPHGRWRIDLAGRADHAGTARLEQRSDPMVVAAEVIGGARAEAARSGVRATVGRIQVRPNTTNTVPGEVSLWLDVRGRTDDAPERLVAAVTQRTERAASLHGVAWSIVPESWSPGVVFDRGLSGLLRRCLDEEGILPSALPTAAGHDAAVLAEHVPAAMLHVRNRTGISHAPEEHATADDCEAGVRVLTRALRTLTA